VTPFKSQLLYQLSYAGAPVIVFAESSAACRRSHGRPRALLSNCCQNRAEVGVGQGLRATSFSVLGTTWLADVLLRGQV
jgi:hypothetical protein